MSDIDWSDPECAVSKHFTVHEMVFLPQWNRLADESDGLDDSVKERLVALANQLDVVRDYFGAALIVHVTYRPAAYNKLVGGAPDSAHTKGMACDFHVSNLSCDDGRQQILDDGKLDTWNMRMEDNPGSNWIHLDMAPVIHKRFFKP